ncbi:hypothetical protein GAMM_170003 [Gammaproteobacteria bacterium]
MGFCVYKIVTIHERRGVTADSDSALALGEALKMEPGFGLIFKKIGIYGMLKKSMCI